MHITEKAVLVKLSIGMPGNTRKDRGITDEVKRNHSLGDKSGRWLKQLYPTEAFEPLVSLSGEARSFHYKNSLPWADEGYRILPTAHHFDYTAKMKSFRRDYEGLADTHFLGKLTEWETQARVMHNGTFNESDYLPADKLRTKFGFSLDVSPIPSGGDFRVTLNQDDMEAMRSDVDSRVQAAVQSANRDLWNRLMEPIGAMVERLKQPDATFRDSLVGNIQEIVELVPKLNITGDAALAAFATQTADDLASLQPQALRDSKSQRRIAADKAQSLLEKMQSYIA